MTEVRHRARRNKKPGNLAGLLDRFHNIGRLVPKPTSPLEQDLDQPNGLGFGHYSLVERPSFPTPLCRVSQPFLADLQSHQQFVVGEVRDDALWVHGVRHQIFLDDCQPST